MQTLTRELRRSLENTVREARRVAETGARKVIQQLAVDNQEPWSSMTLEQRALRNALRDHGRQLGDRRDERRGVQGIDRLTTECAYEHWHRMLFARFLAETNLLIEPESGMDITLEDCRELARERGEDWLELASSFAERMLPEIFRTGDPVLKVALPPETRSALENLLKALPRDVFVADDSLGWVYQYWQADRKDEVNRSEKKIGADELPAVTQLFTEDYMVFFLLHNTLGAWWAGKVLAANPGLASSAKTEDELRAACAVGGLEWTYLRFVRDGDGPWRPAAGIFEGWPKVAKEITVLDPCMGSGHFLVFALPILVALRMAEEGLPHEETVDAVLRDNLFGLEIDPRCTQIAAFNLALAAWRAVGHRSLPRPHLACSGLSLGVSRAEWEKLAERAAAASPVPPERDLLGTKDNLFSARIKTGLERLYDVFSQAPTLGSLINPHNIRGDVFSADFTQIEPMLGEILATKQTNEVAEMAVAAQGMAKAAEILARQFTLVATNVPYLGREGHTETLAEFAVQFAPEAAADLATLFIRRCVSYVNHSGTVSVVLPQNWWVGQAYRDFRKWMLDNTAWRLAAVLGEEAWQTFGNRGPNTILLVLDNAIPSDGADFQALDVATKPGSPVVGIDLKALALAGSARSANLGELASIRKVEQRPLRHSRESRISVSGTTGVTPLSHYVDSGEGCSTGDNDRFLRRSWELNRHEGWLRYCGPGHEHWTYCDTSFVIRWEDGAGELARSSQARMQNTALWNRTGLLVGRVRGITATLFVGGCFSKGAVLVCPRDIAHLAPIYAFLASKEYERAVRSIDPRVSAATSVLTDVSFDLAHWQSIAAKQYPKGVPSPRFADPTQWPFDGRPESSGHVLNVAIARMLGYKWPRQMGSSLPGYPSCAPDVLERHVDSDGIVCFTPLRGDPPASDRLIALLGDALGSEWSAAKLASLLAEVGYEGRSLDDWLHDGFFLQHCELFNQRPFVWHIWDGQRDGFNALVNYHKLAGPNGEGKRTLETLIYTYVGDWIDRQRADQKAGVEGADGRLVAAEHLKVELENILVGEPPYDLFVRWKLIAEQPIGWEPDINDGVQINIRPFINAKSLGARAKGACILRTTPRIEWERDRGKETPCLCEDFPWFWGWDETTENFAGTKTFDGKRWNDLHYSRSFKEAARARSKK